MHNDSFSTTLRLLRAAIVVLGAVLALTLVPDNAKGGVILSPAPTIGGHTGMRSKTDAQTRPRTQRRRRRSSPHELSPVTLSGGGSPPAGAFGSGSVSAGLTFPAMVMSGCELAPPELTSAVHGEGPLFFKPPPVVDLLRPPKV